MERGNLDQAFAVGAQVREINFGSFPGHLEPFAVIGMMVLSLVRATTCTGDSMTKNTTCSKGSKRILP